MGNLLNTHKGLNNKEGKGLMNMVEFYGPKGRLQKNSKMNDIVQKGRRCQKKIKF